MAKILRIKSNHPRLPKKIYLAPTLEAASRLFPNAFIFYQIKWHRLPELVKTVCEKDGLDAVKFFQEKYPWTLIPFRALGSPNGSRRQIIKNDLEKIVSFIKKVDVFRYLSPKEVSEFKWPKGVEEEANVGGFKLPTPKKNGFWPSYTPANVEIYSSNPGSLFHEASERMSVKVGGVFYNTPCEMCSNLFARIHNQCQLKTRTNTKATFCHMNLILNSDSLKEHDDTAQDATPADTSPVVMGSL